LRTIPNKDAIELKRNSALCLLIAGLLITSLTGQAASFSMACEGMSPCCCKRMAAMPDMVADMVPMGAGCCATPQTRPCDLAGPASSPEAPFLPSGFSSGPHTASVPAAAVPTSVSAIDGGAHHGIPIRPPSLADPPIYLQTQSFLC
jgi:hypothetical protein